MRRILLVLLTYSVLAGSAWGADEWQPASYIPLSHVPYDVIAGRPLLFHRDSVAFQSDGAALPADRMRTELFAADAGWEFELVPTLGGEIRPFASDGCLIYGAREDSVFTTTDGREWRFAYQVPPYIMTLFVTNSGAVLAVTAPLGCGRVFRSAPGGEAFEPVLDLEDGVAAKWNFVDTGRYIFVSEYGPKYGPNARRIYRSADDGRTWQPVYDPEYRDTHNHRIVWDPYGDRLIQATGDGFGNRLFIISYDNGDTWRTERQHLYQPTAGFARPEAVYWGMDGQTPYAVARQLRGTDRWEAVLVVGTDRVPREDQFAGNVYDVGEYGGILYAGVSEMAVRPALYTSVDGEHWVLSRRFAANEYGLRFFVGECGGRVLGHYMQSRYETEGNALLVVKPPSVHHLIRGARLEGTVTNLLDTPARSSAEGTLEGWTVIDDASLELDAAMAWHGAQSIHATCPLARTAGVRSPLVSVDAKAGTIVSGAVQVLGPPRGLRLGIVDAAGRTIGETVFFDVSFRWTRAFCAARLAQDTSGLALRLSAEHPYPDFEVWADGLMLSLGTGADTWQIGGQPRAPDLCVHDIRFPPTWTDVFLWVPDPGTDGPFAPTRTLKVYEAADGNKLSIEYDPAANLMRLTDMRNPGATVSTPPFRLAARAVLRIGVVQSPTSRTLAVRIAEDPYVGTTAAPPLDIVRIHLGSTASGGSPGSGLQARHMLFDRVASLEELGRLFADLVTRPDPGDFDDDAHLELDDYAEWVECQGGPYQAVGPAYRTGDIDNDGDVDLKDFRVFQLSYSP